MSATQRISYDIQESNNSRNNYKGQLIHVRFTALAVKIILFVENDGPNRHSSGLSSLGGSMADIPDCESVVNRRLHSKVLTAASIGVEIVLVGVYRFCWRVVTKG